MPGGLATDRAGNVHLVTCDGRSKDQLTAYLSKYDTRGGKVLRRFGMDDERPVRDLATDESGDIYYYAQERWRSDHYPTMSREVEARGGAQARDRFDRLSFGQEFKVQISGGGTWGTTNTRRPDVRTLSIPTGVGSNGVGRKVVWNAYLPSDVSVEAIAVDASGGVYACGYRRIYAGFDYINAGSDPSSFLARYDPSGDLDWMRSHGDHEHDISVAVAVDGSGNAYVADNTPGRTPEKTNRGLFDVRLVKYDPTGELLWMRQFGTQLIDAAFSVAVWPPLLPGDEPREAEAIYVAGVTQGDLYDESADLAPTSELSAFLVGYDPDGKRTFLEQFPLGAEVPQDILDLRLPTNLKEVWEEFLEQVKKSGPLKISPDEAKKPASGPDEHIMWDVMRISWWRRLPVSAFVTTDEKGNVYLAGSSQTSLDADYTNKGSSDIFLMRFAPNPEVIK